jgi:predicted NUDIX family NTP pyrophosphohydrolase
MPGGRVDSGESIGGAAVREVWEETGIEVALDRLVGTYSRPQWNDGGFHVLVFAATSIGGTLRGQPGEVTEAHWFELDDLPAPLLLGQRQRIEDAASGRIGVARSSPVIFPFPSFAAALTARDASPLSRREFYVEQVLEPNRIGEESDAEEVGGDGL